MPEGYWQAPLEANAEMNAEFIIFNHFMDAVDLETETRKLKKHLLDTQSPTGAGRCFPGGEGYLSTTIEAYFALKLTGMRAGDEPMMQARRWILSQGRHREVRARSRASTWRRWGRCRGMRRRRCRSRFRCSRTGSRSTCTSWLRGRAER